MASFDHLADVSDILKKQKIQHLVVGMQQNQDTGEYVFHTLCYMETPVNDRIALMTYLNAISQNISDSVAADLAAEKEKKDSKELKDLVKKPKKPKK